MSTCSLCGRPLVEALTVPTTTGGAVHVVCADAHSRRSRQRRRIRAGITALGFFMILSFALFAGMQAVPLFALVLLLVAMHILINHHWWHHQRQRLRIWSWR